MKTLGIGTRLVGVGVIAVATAFAFVGPAAAATPLIGTFTITAGSCAGGSVSGSYIRMILPSGGPSGPYMSNSDSTCRDQSYTLLAPGSDGGLISGSYQPPPSPAFDSSGNALARRISQPANYYGTSFATGTSPKDPQTGRAVAAPQAFASGGKLSADLRSFAVTWNNQNFNQGAPKPDGSYPGNTRAATGTYDPATGAYSLDWTSQVIGGPFDKFTGQWHLTGRFVPATSSAGGGAGGHAGHGSSGTGSSGTGSSGTGSSGTGSSGRHHGASSTGGGGTTAGADGTKRSGTGSRATSGSRSRSGSAVRTEKPPASSSPVASTTTISREQWRVSWWLIGVAIAVAVIGVGALLGINRALRKAKT